MTGLHQIRAGTQPGLQDDVKKGGTIMKGAVMVEILMVSCDLTGRIDILAVKKFMSESVSTISASRFLSSCNHARVHVLSNLGC